MMNILSKFNLANPKLVFNILRQNIEETVKHPVKRFEIQFLVPEEILNFLVFFEHDEHDIEEYDNNIKFKYFDPATNKKHDSRLYKFDNKKFMDVALKLMKDKTPADAKLDYAIIRVDYRNDKFKADGDLYTTTNGIKSKTPIEI